MTHPLRMRICLPLAATLVAALFLPAAAAGENVVPGQVIVRYVPGSSPAARAEVRSDVGTKPIEGLGMAGAQLLKVTDGDSVSATVRQLESQPDVAYAEPNQILQPAGPPPNDPGFGQQWALNNTGQVINGIGGTNGADINALNAWDINTGSPNTVVAVMDTGADLTHTDLANNIWTNPGETAGDGIDNDGNGYVDDVHGYDFYGGDSNPTDLTGHGTHVSGIIAAEGNNGVNTSGVAQHASLMELRICGTYSAGCPVADEIAAINYAADNGARVLNGSIQGSTFSQATQDALASHPNTLFVFAAGNSSQNNDTNPTYPCSLDQTNGYSADNVICVAATDQNDNLASFSNYGAQSVDLGAPGVNILSSSSQKTFIADDFETNDFASKWTNDPSNTPAGANWARVNESPLTSFGITDSPGADYAPNTHSVVSTNPVTLPPGYSTCEIDYSRSIDLAAGDSFDIDVTLDTSNPPDGTPEVDVNRHFTSASNSGMQDRFFMLTPQFDQGGQLQVKLTLNTDATGEADGVHMDNIKLFCHGSPSDNGTEFLDGTSMAAPMVSGAAALLFSQAPLSTPQQVKADILNSVDPNGSLAGKTVTGGRLDVYRALIGSFNTASGGGGGGSGSGSGGGTTLSRPNTFFSRKPGKVVRTAKPKARVVFKFGSTLSGSSFQCKLDGSPFAPCSSRIVRRLLPGRHVLRVRAVSSVGLADQSAAVDRFKIERIGA